MTNEESLNASTWHKIEETVRQILHTSDLETATELSVRAAAAQRLGGFDLSAFPVRQLISQLVDSFLLYNAISALDTSPLIRPNDADNDDVQRAVNHGKKRQKLSGGGPELHEDYTGKVICQLSDRKRVTTYESNGKTMVSIRDCFIKDGRLHHRKGVNSGMSLTGAEWSTLRNSFPSIEEAMTKLESRVRTEAPAKQDNGNTLNSPTDSAAYNGQPEAGSSDLTKNVHSPSKGKITDHNTSGYVIAQDHYLSDKKQDASTSGLVTTSDSHKDFSAKNQHTEAGQIHYKVNNATPAKQQLIPIQTCRLDGRNYHSWRHQMELFLNQLNLAYVLAEPCPTSINEKFIDDDYICRDHILKSLCDGLFNLYSQKSCSARELWEELKLAYDEDLGTKMSEISKYINFQMVDGVSILDQVQEIHRIADSIIASGSWIDEDFHVSVIVSKLPPSWQEFRVRLMCEGHLPLSVLMQRIQVEEDFRRRYNYEKSHVTQAKGDYVVGMRRKENKRVCYSCGREGHVIKHCPNRKFEASEKSK